MYKFYSIEKMGQWCSDIATCLPSREARERLNEVAEFLLGDLDHFIPGEVRRCEACGFWVPITELSVDDGICEECYKKSKETSDE